MENLEYKAGEAIRWGLATHFMLGQTIKICIKAITACLKNIYTFLNFKTAAFTLFKTGDLNHHSTAAAFTRASGGPFWQSPGFADTSSRCSGRSTEAGQLRKYGRGRTRDRRTWRTTWPRGGRIARPFRPGALAGPARAWAWCSRHREWSPPKIFI